jgi:hypothetical protein
MPFDIEAGQLVTVTQGATVKDHVVIDLTVTRMDPVNDTVSGIGKPNTETVVWVGDEQESLDLTVTSDSTGAWVADFSGSYDILPGMMTYTYEADEDGDQTQIDYWPPTFWVGLHDTWIGGEGWPAGVDLTITVQDLGITFTLTTDAEGDLRGDPAFPEAVEPGWVIIVTDGVTTKTHIVRDISITDADPATEIVRGTATPLTDVWCNPDDAEGTWVEADSSGEWVADFSGSYDITPGSTVTALQEDEDRDFTVFGWQVPRPEGWQHNPATGHDYLYVGDGMTWADAEEYAVSLGGHLVTINDAAENDWLIATFGTQYWMGMNDIAVEGTWVWASGEPVTYTNWHVGEPNDIGGEDGGVVSGPFFGQWNDEAVDQLLDDMVADGRLPNEGVAISIMKQAEKVPLKALTNHLSDLVRRGVITQLTMDQVLVMVAG